MQKANRKFRTDLLWNAGALGLIGVIGVLINVLILKHYDTEALGIYGLLFSLYLILSQLAVGGVHLSVQAFMPRYTSRKDHAGQILYASLLLVTVYSALIMGTCWLGRDVPGIWFGNEAISKGFPYVVAGLCCFAMNKQFVAFHNACRRMRLVAVFQLLRFVFMLGALLVLIGYRVEPWALASALALGEGALFLVAFAVTMAYVPLQINRRTWQWVRIHNRFGNKAVIGNLLFNITTKVDVVMLGVLMDEAAVGVYTFASTIAEGVMQLPMVFRNNINPILTRLHCKNNPVFFNYVVRKNVRRFYKTIAPLSLLSVAGFPVVLLVFQVEESFDEIWAVYAILIAGVAAVAGYLPFQMLFNQIGDATRQSIYIALFFTLNVVANMVLIRFFGLLGAAMGTFTAYVGQAIVLRLMLKSATGYRL